jgi:T5SS/PEP-CTERM-associated repeat protein/autotransporter-associated beta strand protein
VFTAGGGAGAVTVAVNSGSVGILNVGNGAAPGTLSAGSVVFGQSTGQLVFNHTGSLTFPVPVSGPGSLTKLATGTTTLTANNTFTGPVTVSAGLLELSGGGRINNASDSNIANGIGQVASVRITGAGSKWINTASTFIGAVGTGTVTVENGGEFRSDPQILVNRFSNGNGALTVTASVRRR